MIEMARIIGGKFGLEPAGTSPSAQSLHFPWLANANGMTFVSARSAMWWLARTLQIKRVWLPSYLCPTMIEPFVALDVEVKFFPVGKDLALLDTNWIEECADGDLVIYIDYFGFHFPDFPFSELSARNCIVFRDASQALLTPVPDDGSDYQVFSPRKFLGVIDGGILVGSELQALPDRRLEELDSDWVQLSLDAARQRAEFDNFLREDKGWRELFSRSEATMPLGAYSMGETTSHMLRGGLDYSLICQARRTNFLTLLEDLGHLAVFKELPDGVVPLGFPICVVDRDEVQRQLFAEDIFPPVHWKIDGVIPARFSESLQLSRSMMTLPCDQRYSGADMRKVVRSVLQCDPVPCSYLSADAKEKFTCPSAP